MVFSHYSTYLDVEIWYTLRCISLYCAKTGIISPGQRKGWGRPKWGGSYLACREDLVDSSGRQKVTILIIKVAPKALQACGAYQY